MVLYEIKNTDKNYCFDGFCVLVFNIIRSAWKRKLVELYHDARRDDELRWAHGRIYNVGNEFIMDADISRFACADSSWDYIPGSKD